jgi:hypothetical protein
LFRSIEQLLRPLQFGRISSLEQEIESAAQDLDAVTTVMPISDEGIVARRAVTRG